MEYMYEPANRNFEDFASGRVLYNAHGTTAFPVRLASEIVQRCFQLLVKKGAAQPYTLYDPCCGGAYWLAVLGLLHGRSLRRILASDINQNLLGIAEKNLSLLTEVGMNNRISELSTYIQQYGKTSHQDALQSADRLSRLLTDSCLEETFCFQADITKPDGLDERCRHVNIVMADLPYGNIVDWSGGQADPLQRLFDHIRGVLEPSAAVVAIVADKSQKLQHDSYRRLQYFKIGKRHVGIFEPISSAF